MSASSESDLTRIGRGPGRVDARYAMSELMPNDAPGVEPLYRADEKFPEPPSFDDNSRESELRADSTSSDGSDEAPFMLDLKKQRDSTVSGKSASLNEILVEKQLLQPDPPELSSTRTTAFHISPDGYLVPDMGPLTLVESDFDESFRLSTSAERHSNLVTNKVSQDPSADAKRKELIAELARKQSDYMFILAVVFKEYYCDEMVKERIKSLDPDKYVRLFGGFQLIWQFHSDIFLRELSARLEDWKAKSTVCDILVRYMKHIETYDSVIEHLNETITFLDECCQTEPFRGRLDQIKSRAFNQVVRDMEKSRVQFPYGFELKSLLVYVLTWPEFMYKFLADYEALLDPTHPDAADFSNCIDYFGKLASKACEAIQAAKHQLALSDLQARLGSKVPIMDRKRVLVKKGPIIVQRSDSDEIKRRYLILLNDMLIICDQPSYAEEPLKTRRQLDATGMSPSVRVNAFTPSAKEPTKNQQVLNTVNGFSVDFPCVRKSFRFYAKNIQEKNDWFVSFNSVARANKYDPVVSRDNIGKEAPKWIPDLLCQYCVKCNSEFTFINRRHHCRACGYIFCARCSKMEITLEHEGGERSSRVCDQCYDQLKSTFRSGPPSKEDMRARLLRHFAS